MLRSEVGTVEIVQPAASVRADLHVPGDKSIAHRALMLAALAEGESLITGLPQGEDLRATIACLRSLGVRLTPARFAPHMPPPLAGEGRVGAPGWGFRVAPAQTIGGAGWGFATPHGLLDCANSGTTMRLLLGLLAGSRVSATLDGDGSLRRRPMARVIDPLRRMGARIESDDGRAPLFVKGTALQGRRHALSTPSAQVKSAILLAGLAASGPTSVVEPVATRDHLERLLIAMGADLKKMLPPPLAGEGRGGSPSTIELRPSHRPLQPLQVEVPGDFSSAAFWLAAAAIRPGWSVTIQGVGLNPTRTAFLQILERMGARVDVHLGPSEIEPSGSIKVTGGALRAISLDAAEVAAAIDEIPVIITIASQASGVTVINGAAELRVKESDRLAAMAEGLRRMGARVEERPDGISIHGPADLHGATVPSQGDHRIAMALAIAGLVADGPTTIEDADCVAVSYPEFFAELRHITGTGR
jgi:3-phosphoshikimate 1-carboxyvinyltransferase